MTDPLESSPSRRRDPRKDLPTKRGPYPNHQLRIGVRPSVGFAALNYMDHDDPEMSVANPLQPKRPLPEVDMTFNGETGSVFPHTTAIPISDTRKRIAGMASDMEAIKSGQSLDARRIDLGNAPQARATHRSTDTRRITKEHPPAQDAVRNRTREPQAPSSTAIYMPQGDR